MSYRLFDKVLNFLGKSGGNKLLQSHTHASFNDFYVLQNTGWGAQEGAGSNRWAARTAFNQLTASSGAGNSQNLQPYVVTNFIIKY